MREATQQATAELQLYLGKLLSELQNTPPTKTTSTRPKRINTRNKIVEHADIIQDLLAEGLRIATTLFPTKTTPLDPQTGSNAAIGQKRSKETSTHCATELHS